MGQSERAPLAHTTGFRARTCPSLSNRRRPVGCSAEAASAAAVERRRRGAGLLHCPGARSKHERAAARVAPPHRKAASRSCVAINPVGKGAT